METKAEQLLVSLVDPGMANNTGNPEWIRRLLLVSDPRLDEVSETAWYLAADPTQHDTIVRAHLAGEPRPYLEGNSEFERDAHRAQAPAGLWRGRDRIPLSVREPGQVIRACRRRARGLSVRWDERGLQGPWPTPSETVTGSIP
jgi:hypothetical protein